MNEKVITVPKNLKSERELNFDKAESADLIELNLELSQFKSLWEAGVFEMINKIARVNIDDFESEEITESIILNNVIDALKDLKSEKNEVQSLINAIIELFQQALIRGTGVYFFF